MSVFYLIKKEHNERDKQKGNNRFDPKQGAIREIELQGNTMGTWPFSFAIHIK